MKTTSQKHLAYLNRYRSVGKRPLTQVEKYRKHRTKRLAAAKQYRAEHAAQIKAWRDSHLPYFRAKAQERRALTLSVTVNAKEVRRWIISLDSKKKLHCYYCGKPIPRGKLEIDHVIPLIQKGIHAIGNLAATCETCNAQKNRNDPGQWKRAGQQFLAL